MQSRLSALLVAVAAVAWLGGCDERSPFDARFTNELQARNLYAMNGTPPSLPSAISLRGRQGVNQVVRIDPSWLFDFAFDIDSLGVVKVYSVKAIASELPGRLNRVGFAIDSVHGFDQITEAPGSGFKYDTSMTFGPGRVLLIDVVESSCATEFTGFNIRAKLQIDSIDLANRGIHFKILTNPNCGFRSLLPGLPKN
jgi:hypothetical protein